MLDEENVKALADIFNKNVYPIVRKDEERFQQVNKFIAKKKSNAKRTSRKS